MAEARRRHRLATEWFGRAGCVPTDPRRCSLPVPSSAAPSRAEFTRLDVDGLLTRYRTGRAQAALFDPRGGPGLGYDEFVDAAGNVRPA